MQDDTLYIPVKRRDRLCVQVAEQIRDSIVSGHVEAGDRLPPERELCERFGVSRTVLREAIRFLEGEGLLTTRSGSGTYVKRIGGK